MPTDPNPASRWHGSALARLVRYLRSAGAYRSVDGVRWAVMKRFDIPDVQQPEKTYLRRWRMVQTPFAAIYLHKIMMPDGDRDLHDHPYSFASFIIKGGYTEEYVELVPAKCGSRMPPNVYERRVRPWVGPKQDSDRLTPDSIMRTHRRFSFNVIRSTAAHRIRRFSDPTTPTWTLVFVGPRTRVWGFWTTDGFIEHTDYFERIKFKAAP